MRLTMIGEFLILFCCSVVVFSAIYFVLNSFQSTFLTNNFSYLCLKQVQVLLQVSQLYSYYTFCSKSLTTRYLQNWLQFYDHNNYCVMCYFR